jgi:hypothetical protein
MTTRGRLVFFVLWGLTTGYVAWQLALGHHTFDGSGAPFALALLLLLSLAQVRWLREFAPPIPDDGTTTRRGPFVLRAILLLAFLFALATVVGPPLLFGLPAVAVVVLLILRAPVNRQVTAGRQVAVYALGLALIAGVGGLGAGWISDISSPVWAALQVALVLPGLLAGWRLLAYTDLWRWERGGSDWLSRGPGPALRSLLIGVLLGTPWALGLVLLGGSNDDAWVHAWWQPLAAVQPAIAEEAWGRVLLIPLCFIALRRPARTQTALTAAVFVVAYWFAYLHTARDLSPSALINTLLTGTLYALPISYLWLYRGLEMAMGFHFWQDFVRFVAAYLLNRGLWFGP